MICASNIFAPLKHEDSGLNYTSAKPCSNFKRGGGGGGGGAGDSAPFVRGAHEIACLSAGGVLAAVDAVMSGAVSNVYALVRPPGHHATAALGMGFCLYNNVALAALYLQQVHRVPKIAVVDYDVHCGNGTMDAFYDDDSVLVISLHQAGNYPLKTGRVDQLGRGRGEGYTVNVPLPPGSGSGAYRAAFDSVVTPALRAFRPDFILVSSGFDASYNDPLAAMILGSEDFRFFARTLCDLADELCGGRAVFAHEGGYSASYVPFCGVAVIEEMVGVTPSQRVADPFLHEVSSWEYQELQPHQEAVIARAAAVVRKYLVQPS
eukprot:jgi/Mesvir1/19303/Mv10373-RA.1